MRSFQFLGEEIYPPAIAAALVLGSAGGLAAKALGLPLPWLLGALVTTAAAALGGIRLNGRVLGVPMNVRTGFIPVIGVAIGTAVTPEILSDAGRWWPSLLALFVYVPLAHAIGYTMTRRMGGLDPITSLYGTMPGGFIEALTLGEKNGADPALLTLLQFLRLIFCIVLIPIGFSLWTGHAVGSASGAVIGGADKVLSGPDWLILIAAGGIGAFVGVRFGFPAGIMTGPFLASGLVHFLGIVEAGPPGWLVDVTQLVVGTSLGGRFAGRSPEILLRGARIAAANVGAMLVLAGVLSALLPRAVGESAGAVFLAFAPGGLAEMSLVALSLEISVIYVTLHHIVRIILAVLVARIASRRMLRS